MQSKEGVLEATDGPDANHVKALSEVVGVRGKHEGHGKWPSQILKLTAGGIQG